MDNRQLAYDNLMVLAEKQGYVTFDNIMDCADEYSLPIQDFDWLSSSIPTRGVLIYSEVPAHTTLAEDDDYDDYAQSDYEVVYERIIELSPSLDPFVSFVKSVIPPQRGEINQLKYQIVDGNLYARDRMIEMHLRLALRVALQRAEAYDLDIEDAVGDALIGLVTAVDKYDPDTAGAFASYASLWILQNISREQSTQRPFIYYPAHKKEDYFTLYPLIKRHGCIGCEQINKCPIAISIVKKRIECSEEGASKVLEQMMQDTSLDMLIDQFNECAIDHEYADIDIGDIICYISYETAISAEEALSSVNAKLLHEEISNITDNLTPKEARVIRLRYGLDGHARTLEEVGDIFGVTRERIRQIESKALRKMKNPLYLKRLEDYL